MQIKTERLKKAKTPREGLRAFLKAHEGKEVFLEHEVKGLLSGLGLSVPRGVFIRKSAQAPLGAGVRYPVSAKVMSRSIGSKTEAGGVRLGIQDEAALSKAARELMRIEGAEGILVEEMAGKGVEVVVGGIIDTQFGPVVMFGLGGIFVELMGDVAFALAPAKRKDALWLVSRIKGRELLFGGVRGLPGVDIKTLCRTIILVSELMATGLIEEIDLNPVVLYPEGALVLDAKMKKRT